jgi:hypothetical protein
MTKKELIGGIAALLMILALALLAGRANSHPPCGAQYPIVTPAQVCGFEQVVNSSGQIVEVYVCR